MTSGKAHQGLALGGGGGVTSGKAGAGSASRHQCHASSHAVRSGVALVSMLRYVYHQACACLPSSVVHCQSDSRHQRTLGLFGTRHIHEP
jgi:hypothetical protein